MAEHEGHRKRLIEKLSKGEVLEHEVLEALLFNALPRQNTNDLAHRLLAQFGSVPGVFSASMEDLKKVKGVGESVAAYLFCIGQFFNRYYQRTPFEIPTDYEPNAFLEFVRVSYRQETVETVDCYLLDINGKILYRRRFTSAALDAAKIGSDLFLDLFTEPKLAGLVLVHNHPCGSQMPSEKDDAATKKCVLACNMHNVLFCEHVISCRSGVFSYHLDGRLRKIAQKCSARRIFTGLEDLHEQK